MGNNTEIKKPAKSLLDVIKPVLPLVPNKTQDIKLGKFIDERTFVTSLINKMIPGRQDITHFLHIRLLYHLYKDSDLQFLFFDTMVTVNFVNHKYKRNVIFHVPREFSYALAKFKERLAEIVYLELEGNSFDKGINTNNRSIYNIFDF
jgi:hypothetical protein